MGKKCKKGQQGFTTCSKSDHSLKSFGRRNNNKAVFAAVVVAASVVAAAVPSANPNRVLRPAKSILITDHGPIAASNNNNNNNSGTFVDDSHVGGGERRNPPRAKADAAANGLYKTMSKYAEHQIT